MAVCVTVWEDFSSNLSIFRQAILLYIFPWVVGSAESKKDTNIARPSRILEVMIRYIETSYSARCGT